MSKKKSKRVEAGPQTKNHQKAQMKSKFTADRIQIILKTLEQTGSDQAAIKAAGISKTRFYDRLQKDGEFRDRVAQAKAEFSRQCPEQIKNEAMKQLIDLLEHGQIVTWKSTETTYDAAGNIVQIKEKIQTQTSPTPYWVIERILGKPATPDPLLSRLQSLVEEGLALPEQAQIVQQGLTLITAGLTEFSSKIKLQTEGENE